MGYGDEILAAGQAQRYFDAHGVPSIITDQQGLPRQHPIWNDNPAVVQQIEPGQYHCIQNGPHCRPYIVYPFVAESGWTFNRDFHARDHVARIYLTADERRGGTRLRERLGPFVLIEPWSKHANLRWPLDAWHVLVAARSDLTFVQHLHAGSGDCVVRGAEYIYTTTFRDACGVLAAASLYVRGESGMCHAAAALGIPQVTIWGGCMDWDVLGRYPKQIGVGVTAPCCGQWLPCAHCATIMARIAPRTVSDAIDLGLETRAADHGVR